MFETVTRQKSKLRMGLVGTSGSGKTLGALYIAYGITADWSRIALIDTEHERGRFYANRTDLEIPTGEFLYQSLTAPYSPEKYIAYVKEAAAAPSRHRGRRTTLSSIWRLHQRPRAASRRWRALLS